MTPSARSRLSDVGAPLRNQGVGHEAIAALRSITKSLDRVKRVFVYYPRLQRVQEYVFTHVDNPISLRDVALVAACDRRWFCTYFRERVAMTFGQWTRLVRAQRACHILATCDCSIAETAALVGFRSVRTFERVFYSLLGMAPGAFKRAVSPVTSWSASPVK